MKKALLLWILNMIIVVGHSKVNESFESESDFDGFNRELDNPLAQRWSLVFQENFGINEGTGSVGNVISNASFFQHAIPIPFGNNKIFTTDLYFRLLHNQILLLIPTVIKSPNI